MPKLLGNFKRRLSRPPRTSRSIAGRLSKAVRIYEPQWARSDIGKSIESAFQSDWIALNIPPDRRLVIAEVVVVQSTMQQMPPILVERIALQRRLC